MNSEMKAKYDKMSKSDIKTWFRRNEFKLTYRDNWRTVIKYGSGCFNRNGRYFRVRNNGSDCAWVVDVSEPVANFDRWANSTEIREIPLEKFMSEYMR
jgi:hypothetical protein